MTDVCMVTATYLDLFTSWAIWTKSHCIMYSDLECCIQLILRFYWHYIFFDLQYIFIYIIMDSCIIHVYHVQNLFHYHPYLSSMYPSFSQENTTNVWTFTGVSTWLSRDLASPATGSATCSHMARLGDGGCSCLLILGRMTSVRSLHGGRFSYMSLYMYI